MLAALVGSSCRRLLSAAFYFSPCVVGLGAVATLPELGALWCGTRLRRPSEWHLLQRLPRGWVCAQERGTTRGAPREGHRSTTRSAALRSRCEEDLCGVDVTRTCCVGCLSRDSAVFAQDRMSVCVPLRYVTTAALSTAASMRATDRPCYWCNVVLLMHVKTILSLTGRASRVHILACRPTPSIADTCPLTGRHVGPSVQAMLCGMQSVPMAHVNAFMRFQRWWSQTATCSMVLNHAPLATRRCESLRSESEARYRSAGVKPGKHLMRGLVPIISGAPSTNHRTTSPEKATSSHHEYQRFDT